MRKPAWLNKKVNLGACREIKTILRELNLRTVCEESLCPNISECFPSGAAAFMILGRICTRQCRFCAVKRGEPFVVDAAEPARVAAAVKRLNLQYVVITSPTRDDLPDGGAAVFCRTIREIKTLRPGVRVEILIPDFLGQRDSLKKAAASGADVIAHNLETVPSLYHNVRRGADYRRSLNVLREVKEINKNIPTKSGLMLGLGEKYSELIDVFKDLRNVGCDFLTLGQYLPPSLTHYPVQDYASPDFFSSLEKAAQNLGFKGVKSAPYVRSSFLAHTLI